MPENKIYNRKILWVFSFLDFYNWNINPHAKFS